jgi:hypothetical protein
VADLKLPRGRHISADDPQDDALTQQPHRATTMSVQVSSVPKLLLAAALVGGASYKITQTVTETSQRQLQKIHATEQLAEEVKAVRRFLQMTNEHRPKPAPPTPLQ